MMIVYHRSDWSHIVPKGDRKPYKGCLECGEKIFSHGLCYAHNRQAVRDRGFRLRFGIPDCSLDGCSNMLDSRGFCGKHYKQFRAGKTFTFTEARDPELAYAGPSGCLFAGCPRDHVKQSGFCVIHRKLMTRYGMTIESLLSAFSDPKCSICGKIDGLSIDHDHSCCEMQYGTCGQCNRGLLCRDCNWAIGAMKDSPQLLRAAADYLESNSRI